MLPPAEAKGFHQWKLPWLGSPVPHALVKFYQLRPGVSWLLLDIASILLFVAPHACLYLLAVIRDNNTSISTPPPPPFLAKQVKVKKKHRFNVVRINLEKLFPSWTSAELLCVGVSLLKHLMCSAVCVFFSSWVEKHKIPSFISPFLPFSNSSPLKLVNQKLFYQITKIIRSVQWLVVVFNQANFNSLK